MTDPYKVLQISSNATDDEVRDAYRELSKKYHPDIHQDSQATDILEEKMAELNSAYDQIMDLRRGGGQAAQAGGFAEIRRQIQLGNLTVADDMLENNSTERNAEWSFLKGSVCYGRGWLNDAFSHFSDAVKREPKNPEYNAALKQMTEARAGNMNGNPQPYNTNSIGGCSVCDLCQGMVCANCCCNCLGNGC